MIKLKCPKCGNTVEVLSGEAWCPGSANRASSKAHPVRKMKPVKEAKDG